MTQFTGGSVPSSSDNLSGLILPLASIEEASDSFPLTQAGLLSKPLMSSRFTHNPHDWRPHSMDATGNDSGGYGGLTFHISQVSLAVRDLRQDHGELLARLRVGPAGTFTITGRPATQHRVRVKRLTTRCEVRR